MIDTLAIVRKLSDSGIKRVEAEAHAEAIADAFDQQYSELATKDFVRNQISIVRGEISNLEAKISDLRGEMKSGYSDLEAKIDDLRSEMNSEFIDLGAKIDAVGTRLVRWIVGTWLVVPVLIVTVFFTMVSVF